MDEASACTDPLLLRRRRPGSIRWTATPRTVGDQCAQFRAVPHSVWCPFWPRVWP
jgi:hypothetical protein